MRRPDRGTMEGIGALVMRNACSVTGPGGCATRMIQGRGGGGSVVLLLAGTSSSSTSSCQSNPCLLAQIRRGEGREPVAGSGEGTPVRLALDPTSGSLGLPRSSMVFTARMTARRQFRRGWIQNNVGGVKHQEIEELSESWIACATERRVIA